MPRHSPIQNSFNGGEWSPRMYGRTDLPKYQSAVKRLKNFLITPQGAAMRRSGLRYVAEQASSAAAGRLWPFIFSDEQAYMLLFENQKLRIFRNEGQLVTPTLSSLNPNTYVDPTTDQFEVTHGFQNDEGPYEITSTGTLPGGLAASTPYYIVLPATQIIPSASVDTSNNDFNIADHGLVEGMGPFQISTTNTLPGGLAANTDYYVKFVDADNFGLSTTAGGTIITLTSTGAGTHTLVPTDEYKRSKFRVTNNPGSAALAISSTGTGLHTWTPTSPQAIEIDTPYLSADLDELAFAQSADVLYIVHKSYEPRKLQRFSASSFQLARVEFVDGPYLTENTTVITLQPSATSGSNVTLTASEAIFVGNDVNRLVRIYGGAHWGYAEITSVNPFTFTDSEIASHTFATGAVNTGTDVITITGHSFSTGELVYHTTTGTPIQYDTTEDLTQAWVRDLSANTLALYPTEADANADTNRLDLTGVGSGTLKLTSNRVNLAAHGLSGGEGVVAFDNIGGALPIGLDAVSGNYFVVRIDADYVAFSDGRGGPQVAIQNAVGGGTHTMSGDDVPRATCTIDVKATFENTTARTTWRLGAWGRRPELGFPRAVTFQEQRLWFASEPGQPQTLHASKSADFESFSPTGQITDTITDLDNSVSDDNAIQFAIGSNEVNVIQWLVPVRTLLLGTTSANWTAQAALVSEAITPTNLQVRRSGAHGSALIQPVVIDDRVVYVSDTKRKLFTLGYSFDSDAYLSEDLTLLADQMLCSGVRSMDFAHEPWSMVWAACTAGRVPAMTIVRDQDILGWAEHEIGGAFVAAYNLTIGSVDLTANTLASSAAHSLSTGDRVRFQGTLPSPLVAHRDYWVRRIDDDELAIYAAQDNATADQSRLDLTSSATGATFGKATHAVVESVGVIPAPAGDASLVGRENMAHDQPWMTVKLTVGGATKRYVGFIEDHFEDDDILEDAFFADLGITYNGAATTSITGITHLGGETVDVLADGEVLRDQAVSSAGVLTLATAAAKVHIGYRFMSDLESLRLNVPSPDGGTAQAKLGRLDHLVVRLNRTINGKFGADSETLEAFDLVPFDHPMDELVPLFTGDATVAVNAPWEDEVQFFVRQDDPVPMTVVAVLSELQKSARSDRK